MLHSRAILVLLAAMAVGVWLWQRADPQPDPQHATSPESATSPKPAIASTTTEPEGRIPPAASTVDTARPTFTAPPASDPGVTASNAGPAPAAPSASLRLDVRAPPSARTGERFTVTIEVEALGGIRNLSFAVSYDRELLDFVSSSPGSFVQQASAPATLSAEDTSAGNVFVNMDIKNGGIVAAAGTLVVLEFNALRAGTSPITLSDVTFQGSGRSSVSTAAAVRPASVIVE